MSVDGELITGEGNTASNNLRLFECNKFSIHASMDNYGKTYWKLSNPSVVGVRRGL